MLSEESITGPAQPSPRERHHRGEMKRCVRCIMPDGVPGITFDENGICNHCTSFTSAEPQGETKLRELLDSVRGRGEPYECLVPISGGRDSTYVLYMAKAVYGLHVLAVNADNEFRHEQAVDNLERACRRLDVELVCVRSRREIDHKIVRANVRAGIPLGLPTLVGSFCRQCSYGYFSVVYREAIQRRIPLIIWGTSPAESTRSRHDLSIKPMRRSRYLKLTDPHLYQTELYSLLQRLEFHVPGNSLWSRGVPVLKDSAIREISLFDYLPWDRRLIKETVSTKLDWRKPEDHATSWRMDCKLHQVVNYLMVKLMGYSQDCVGFCNMIACGQMSREEALAQEEAIIATCGDHVEEVLRAVGFREPEVARIRSMEHA